MAKNRPKKDKPLPYVQVAAFSENVLDEKDSVLSCIRIFDRIVIPEPGPPPPSLPPDAKPFLPVRALILLKSGQAKGKRIIKLVPESPHGEDGEIVETPAVFEGGENGVSIHFLAKFRVSGEGLYWCNVYVDETLITRMPLRIAFAKPIEEKNGTSRS